MSSVVAVAVVVALPAFAGHTRGRSYDFRRRTDHAAPGKASPAPHSQGEGERDGPGWPTGRASTPILCDSSAPPQLWEQPA